MGMNKLDNAHDLLIRRTHWLFDDFDHYTDTDIWTKTATGAGATITNADADNGLLTLTTGTTANNGALIAGTRKNWKFVNNKPLVFEARINFAEANVNTSGIFLGFSSVLTNVLLQDTTTVPATNFSGAGIYKLTGETVWRTISSVGTGQNTAKSTTSSGVSNDVILRIEIEPVSSTLAEVSFFVWDPTNNQQQPLFDAALTNVGNRPIKHQLTYTSAAAMAPVVLAKYISGGVTEVLNVDYVAAGRLR